MRSASRFSMMKLLMGEPPSFSGKNQLSLQESALRFSVVKGMPTGPGTSEGQTARVQCLRLNTASYGAMLRDWMSSLPLTQNLNGDVLCLLATNVFSSQCVDTKVPPGTRFNDQR